MNHLQLQGACQLGPKRTFQLGASQQNIEDSPCSDYLSASTPKQCKANCHMSHNLNFSAGCFSAPQIQKGCGYGALNVNSSGIFQTTFRTIDSSKCLVQNALRPIQNPDRRCGGSIAQVFWGPTPPNQQLLDCSWPM